MSGRSSPGSTSAFGRPSGDGPGSMTTQNYMAPVGNVFNIENNYFGRSAPVVDAQLPPHDKVALAPMLVNREQQRDAVLDTIVTKRAGGGGTVLIVVPGARADMHFAFVLRCAILELTEAGGEGWAYAGQLPWPERKLSGESLFRGLRDALNLKCGSDAAEVSQAFSTRPGNVCFSHHVDAAAWERDGGALLKEWVGYFTAGRLKAAQGSMLLAFLCVELEDTFDRPPRTRLQQWLRAYGRTKRHPLGTFVEMLEMQMNAGASGILVLPPLGSITRAHLLEWVSRVSRYFRSDMAAADLADVPDLVFPSGASELRYVAVFNAVRSILDQRYRRRLMFEEHGR